MQTVLRRITVVLTAGFLVPGITAIARGMTQTPETFTISSEVSCPECRIVLRKVATIGGVAEDEGWVALGSKLAQDSRGRYYLAPTYTTGEIMMFDERGQLLKRFGRKGRGPGEFESIERIWVSAGDTLHVFDRLTRRHTVYSPSQDVVRMERSGAPYDVVFEPNGFTIEQYEGMSPERIGYPLQLVAPDGKIVRSFGAENPEYRTDRPYDHFRALAAAGDGGVWSAHHNRYRIELWDTTGVERRVLVRDAEWFRPWTQRDMLEHARPILRSIHQDGRGRLWVLITMPSAAAKGRADDADTKHDTMIEVIDTHTHRLLTTRRVPHGMYQWFAGTCLWNYRQDGLGNLYLDVWQVQLVGERQIS